MCQGKSRSVDNLEDRVTDQAMDDDSDELTAYHEAGHVVMALLTGASVQQVTIAPDRDDGPARFGDTSVIWPRDGYGRRELAEAMIRVSLAGPVVEMIYTGDPYHPGMMAQWAEDWRSAWEAACELESNELRRLRMLELETKHLVQQLQDDDVWAAVAELADNLLAHETLDAEQIEEITNQWLK